MSRFIGGVLVFGAGIVMVDAGITITDWHWWGIVVPMIVGSVMG